MVSVNSLRFDNPEDIYGFRRGRKVLDAVKRVQPWLQARSPVTSADFTKAYNTVIRGKILQLLRGRLQPEDYQITSAILEHQSIKILDRQFRCQDGVPRGSTVAPVLFNHLMDALITNIKEKWPQNEVACYADDICIKGRIKVNLFSEISEEFGLMIDTKKSYTLNYNQDH